jgi:hypothetical protein
MFNGAEDCTFNGGKYEVKNAASMLNNTKKCTFNGGKFDASGDGGM